MNDPLAETSKFEEQSDSPITSFFKSLQALLGKSRSVDFLGPLALRLYLVPIFWMAGTKKFAGFEDTVEWFGNTDWGLGLPFPTLMVILAAGSEFLGAILLFVGLAVRWICIPLIMTMLVAIFSVHWENGWLAIAEGEGFFASERTAGAIERLSRGKDILQEYGNYDWLTENGAFVVLNNGIEFATTYLIMLLALFFTGAGRYVSLDYWIGQRFR